jgi:hypothetical protein
MACWVVAWALNCSQFCVITLSLHNLTGLIDVCFNIDTLSILNQRKVRKLEQDVNYEAGGE